MTCTGLYPVDCYKQVAYYHLLDWPLLTVGVPEWGFKGFVLSDCDTLPAVEQNFHFTAGLQQSVSVSVKAGNDLNCGPQYADLVNASISGFIETSDLDVAVSRLLRRRIQVIRSASQSAGSASLLPLNLLALLLCCLSICCNGFEG